MKKTIYLLIAVAMLLGMLPQPATADELIFMYVSNFELVTKGPPNKVTPFVTATILEAINDQPLSKAAVTIRQTNDCPGWITTDTFTARTNLQGVVKFNVELPADCTIYLMVEDVVKTGYLYEPEYNTVDARIVVNP
ncbi:MAG: hypothetical protein MUC85_08250 [Anaerolineales bacterium]|nr:hypothetical protein [Anaerolineales bacterium]